jgi:hypothetical protein
MKNIALLAILFYAVSGVSAQSCDTLRNYDLSDPLYSFTGDYGHALGHDFLGAGVNPVTAWAEPYSVPSAIEVRVIQFIPWKVHNAGGAVQFHIYEDAGGEPGASLYNQTVALSSLQELVYSTIDINPGFEVNGNFWVGFQLAYNNPQDTFAILGTFKPGGTNYTKLFANGSWQDTDDVYEINGSDPFVSAWGLDVMVSNAPDPVAAFSSNWSACLSGVFNPNASASQNVDQFDWILGDANPYTTTYATGSGVNPAIAPTQVGEDQGLYLLAYGGCRLNQIGYLVDVFDDINASFSTTSATCGLNNGVINIVNPTGGTGSYSYQLNGGGAIGAPTFSNLAPNTYNVTINSSGNGCQETYQVTVGAIPQETISVGTGPIICSGQSASITASGNGSIEWFLGGSSIGTGTNISVSPSTTTTYQAVLTDSNGCEDTDEVVVTVNALPTVSAGANVAICIGQSTTLTASGAATYAWDSGLGNGQTKTVSPTSTSTYEVTGTDGNGCQNTATVEVTVNSLPTVNAGANQEICDGGSATLTASGAVSYVWDNGPTGATQTVSPSITSVYEVTGTDGNGCQNTDQVEVEVLPVDDASFTFNNFCDAVSANGPTNIATAGGAFAFNPAPGDGATINSTTGEIGNFTTGNTYSVEYTTNGTCPSSSIQIVTVQSTDDASFTFDNICIGNNLPLAPYNIATANGIFDFNVAPIDGAIINNTTGEISNPTLGNTYEVIYTTPTGDCQASSVESVTVYTAPTVVASNDTTICNTEEITISASGADSYTWNNGLGIGVSHLISPSSTTLYTVTGTDNTTGCQNFDDVTITVNALPNVLAIASQTEICDGQSLTIDAVGAVTYEWNNNIGAGNTHTISPSVTTTYEVIGEDGNGCENSSSVTIIVKASPNLVVTNDSEICEGDNITISASGADGYVWDNGLNPIAAHIVSPNTTTTYTVTGENANGCQNQGTVTITVNEVPVVNAGDDQTVCAGEEITLIGQTSIGSLSWDQGVDDGVAFVPTATTTYTVTAENNGCTATDQVEVVINPLPSVEAGDDRTACLNHNPQSLEGIPAGGEFSGPGVDNNVFDPGTAGIGSHEITYTYTDNNGCSNTGSFTFVVDGCAAVEEVASLGVVVYPNPTTQQVMVKLDEGLNALSIQLFSVDGKLITTQTVNPGNTTYTLDLTAVATGTYVLKVNTSAEQFVKKLVVQ